MSQNMPFILSSFFVTVTLLRSYTLLFPVEKIKNKLSSSPSSAAHSSYWAVSYCFKRRTIVHLLKWKQLWLFRCQGINKRMKKYTDVPETALDTLPQTQLRAIGYYNVRALQLGFNHQEHACCQLNHANEPCAYAKWKTLSADIYLLLKTRVYYIGWSSLIKQCYFQWFYLPHLAGKY